MKFPGARLPAWVVLAAAGVMAVVVTMSGCSSTGDDGAAGTDKIEVGNCLDFVEGTTVDPRTEVVDCSSAMAVYQVTRSSDTKVECAAGLTPREETLTGGATAFLCLAPNFMEGSCYNESGMTGYQHVDCGSPEATFRVVTRIDGRANELLCGPEADSFRLVESDPKTTFCTAQPAG
ncbi:hypothetical protein [Nocardia sp. CNY236]|uniref:LppU/SCO3897 family protein n=1 Tax=Nocardia sp. CNY236 TaxID=1169152 RepID=UPI0004146F94|nr:hypothetical protein [Nocardia sp. CNY236]